MADTSDPSKQAGFFRRLRQRLLSTLPREGQAPRIESKSDIPDGAPATPDATQSTTPDSATLTREELTLIKKISQYIPWGVQPDDTTDCPLFPSHHDTEGKAKAIPRERNDRSSPYYLRGRGDEFNKLASSLIENPIPIQLVTGPPGTGKTALLDAVTAYAQRIGHTTVKLRPKDLASTETIIQKCRDAVMSTTDAPVESETSQTVTGHLQLHGEMEIMFDKLGAQLQGGMQNTTTRKTIGNIDLVKHLQAICSYGGRNRPLLIHIDEIQKLDVNKKFLQEHKDTISDNLYVLNDLCLPNAENLPVTTILAGLPTSGNIIRPFISRFGKGCIIEIGPVDTPYIRQILEDYLNIQQPCEIQPAMVNPKLLDKWAQDCQGHVLLANHLGYALQKHIISHIQGKPDFTINSANDANIPIPEDFHQDTRDEYYQEQLPDNPEHPIIDILHHIVQASLHNRDPEHPIPPHTQPSNIPQPITWSAARAMPPSIEYSTHQ